MNRKLVLGLLSLVVVGLSATIVLPRALSPVQTTMPTSFGVASRFILQVEFIPDTRFLEVSGFGCQTEVVQVRDPETTHISSMPGVTTCGPIVAKGGLTDTLGLWNWYQGVSVGNFQRRNGTVDILDATGNLAAKYVFYNAWPASYKLGTLNTRSDQVAIEELVIVPELISRIR